jgi:hypothetical protein
LASWVGGNMAAARAGFETVKEARGGIDGPSQFYLQQIERANPSPGWTGEVALEGK